MKIAYVTHYDAKDILNWSGAGYYIARSLEQQGALVEYIGSLHKHPGIFMKLKHRWYKSQGKFFDYYREPLIAEQFAKQISSRLSKDTDVVFSPGSITLPLLKTSVPKVIYTDASFGPMVGFYPGFSNFCKETIDHANFLEKKALDSASLLIYSSEWAARTTIEHYGIDPSKVKVVPFGANIECDRNLADIDSLVDNKDWSVCNLLFLGVDWERKGGSMAVAVARELETMGIPTKLHVAGISSIPLEDQGPFIVNHGFISKRTREGKAKINNLLSSSHFLILPSIADCTPIVYPEANSFGLPCITTDVGGIPSVIRNNVNGMMFPLEALPSEYARYIAKVFTEKNRYRELALNSFKEYNERLNWAVTGKKLIELLDELR